jgi:hypothetical protein
LAAGWLLIDYVEFLRQLFDSIAEPFRPGPPGAVKHPQRFPI